MGKYLLSLLVLLITTALSRTQSPPRLIRNLQDSYTIYPTVLTRLQLCKFNGQPSPTVTWTLNGNSLPTSSDSGGVYYLEGNGTLIVGRAGSSDNGLYECTGRNLYGAVSARTQITFTRPSVRWYIDWYMWIVYSLVIWALSIFFFIGWFFYKKKGQKLTSLLLMDG